MINLKLILDFKLRTYENINFICKIKEENNSLNTKDYISLYENIYIKINVL